MHESQKAEAKRAEEATKRYDAQVAALKRAGIKDPERFMQDPDSAFREAAHDYVRRQIEEADMDPRELEFMRREETLKERESRIAQEEEARVAAQKAQAVEAKTQEHATTISQALEASNLPRNRFTVARMATLMLAAGKKGVDVTPQQLVQIVARELDQEQQHHVESRRSDPQALVSTFKSYLSGVTLDGSQIVDFLGPEHTEAVRKHLLAGAQSKFNGTQPQPTRQRAPKIGVPESKHPNGYHTLDEYNEMRRRAQARK
jgi:hypothetical protein